MPSSTSLLPQKPAPEAIESAFHHPNKLKPTTDGREQCTPQNTIIKSIHVAPDSLLTPSNGQ